MGTFLAGDLKTGLIRVRNIPVSSGTAEAALNNAGTINCTVKLPMVDPQTSVSLDFTDIIVPGKSFLAYEENGKIINAGPIWSDNFDVDSKRLQISAAGMRSYFDYRFVIPLLNDADMTDVPTKHTTVYTNLSLRTIAKRIVQQAVAWTNGHVPIVFEPDVPGDAQREYPGGQFHVVNEKLSQLSEVENGPDIMMTPRFSEDKNYVEWVLETGDPELRQDGPDHIWDTTVISPSVQNASLRRSAVGLVTDSYQQGSDQKETNDNDPIMAKSWDPTLTNIGYVRFEDYENRASVEKITTLQEHADEKVFLGRYHMETWQFDTRNDSEPTIQTVAVGDYGILRVKGLGRISDGDHQIRVMRVNANVESAFSTYYCAPARVRV